MRDNDYIHKANEAHFNQLMDLINLDNEIK